MWPNGGGSKVHVGLENGDALVSIDTKTNTKLSETGSSQADFLKTALAALK